MRSSILSILISILLSHSVVGSDVVNAEEPKFLAAATYVMDNLYEQDYNFLNLLTNNNKGVYIPRIIQASTKQSSDNNDADPNEYHTLTIMIVENDDPIEFCLGSFDVTVAVIVNDDNAVEEEWSVVEWGEEHTCDDSIKGGGGVFSSGTPLTPSRPLAGGYSPVDDIQSPELLETVEFVMLQIQGVDITNIREYDFYPLPQEERYNARIIDAMEKVVAGKLFKISLAIESSNLNNGECVGAFQVTVFDSFGTLSIQSWGSELTCDGIVKYPQEQEQTGDQQVGNGNSQTGNHEDARTQDSMGSSASIRSTQFIGFWLCLISFGWRLI